MSVSRHFRGAIGLLMAVLAIGSLGTAKSESPPTTGHNAPSAAKAPPSIAVKLPPPPPGSEGDFPRPVKSWLEAQIALAREGISSGSIDGVPGGQSVAALQ